MIRGRQTGLTPELAQSICEDFRRGMTAAAICAQDGRPSEATLWRWAVNDKEFREAVEQARQDGSTARPTELTPALAEAICDDIRSGLDIDALTKRKDRPSPRRIRTWTKTDAAFREAVEAARQERRLAGHGKPGSDGRKAPAPYSRGLLELILDAVEKDGETLGSVCGRPGMPHRLTALAWLRKEPDLGDRHRAIAAGKKAKKAEATAGEASADAAAPPPPPGPAMTPLDFVMAAFPWRQAGTPLAAKRGPLAWQREVLARIGAGLDAQLAVQEAVASGHGVGKSALVAWLILWAMTREDTRGVVTANTDVQLRTKTWSELSKWHRLWKDRAGFRLTASALHRAEKDREKTWRIDAVAWSASNTEAFAGLHNEGRRILVVFDEASAIPDIIWETTEGALTDDGTEIVWCAFGNPTRNSGRFRECFGRFRHRWSTRQVDSRTVEITNKAQIESWIEDYGEDSDFARVRVKGVFPRAGSMQFIAADRVEAAMGRTVEAEIGVVEPLVIGVDVARFGDDQTVIAFRRGRDARSIPWITLRGADTMQVAGRVSEAVAQHRPEAVFVDEGGVGAGVIDRLRQLNVSAMGVNFSSAPCGLNLEEGVKVKNKRAEMWAAARTWIKAGALPDDPELAADLTGVEYGFDADNAIQLEKKETMKRRGLASPDKGDALALTFAYPVAVKPKPRGPRLRDYYHGPYAWMA